jgi:hypothetical protein
VAVFWGVSEVSGAAEGGLGGNKRGSLNIIFGIRTVFWPVGVREDVNRWVIVGEG